MPPCLTKKSWKLRMIMFCRIQLWTVSFERKTENRQKGVWIILFYKGPFFEVMERPDNVQFSNAPVFLDAHIDWVAAAMYLSNKSDDKLSLPKAAWWFLCKEKKRKLQTGHNDFKYTHSGNPGYFVIVSNPEDGTLYVRPAFRVSIHYCDENKLKLEAVLKIRELTSKKDSTSVKNATISSHELNLMDSGSHCLRKHYYESPTDADLKDAIIPAHKYYSQCQKRMYMELLSIITTTVPATNTKGETMAVIEMK